jgi:intergrase/recombinase
LIDYQKHRAGFLCFLESKKFTSRYPKDLVTYLDRYVEVIADPTDILKICSELTSGQQKNLSRGLRNLFNYLEIAGFDPAYLDRLRKALPKDRDGYDLKIPTEEEILDSLKRLREIPAKYAVLYDVLLDSGLRLVEAIRLIRSFDGADTVNGFYRCQLGMFRGSKQAYYGHLTKHTRSLLSNANGEELKAGNASHYYQKYGFVNPKYLRKFAFDKMIELEIPESVADFIQGRVPKRIGAKHYMALARQASKFYPRYAEYISRLRQKVLA